MGKKDKKKKGLGKAKTEAREAKKAEKALRKNMSQAEGEDVEAILAEILAKEAAETVVTILRDVSPPKPRTAFSMTASTSSDSDLILFGGEHFTGERATFFNDTYAYHIDKNTWTRFDSPTRPPPRSGHAVCSHKNFMYLFGGEFSNPCLSQYRHYRDFWRLDFEDMSWEKIDVRSAPSARSGHRMCVVSNKLLVFGGYYDNGFENKYLNDMYMIDMSMDEFCWSKVATSAVDIVPSPRSGFQWAAFGDEVYLYGGYCRESVSKAKNVSRKGTKKGGADAVEELQAARGIVHSDMYKLNGETLKWQKVKRSGYGPSNRSGFSAVVHKRSLVVFGGVEDDETEEEFSSVFYNDCFGFNVDRKKWYPMTVRRRHAKAARRRRKKTDVLDEDLSELGFSTGQNDEALSESSSSDRNNQGIRGKQGDSEQCAGGMNDDNEDGEIDAEVMAAALREEERVELTPCGRFNACVAIQRNVMYIMGGVLEKKDKDVTLDDMWGLDLNKLDEFHQIKDLSTESAEWIQSDEDEEDDDSGEDQEKEVDSDQDEPENELDAEDDKLGKKRRHMRLKQRITHDDDMMMPRVFETLKEYHDRTKAYWIGEVHEAHGGSGKELRKTAFEWAWKRYNEIKPTLREIEELEEEFAREAKLEEESAKTKVDEQRGRSRR